MNKTIGVLTGGGDSPGLNAVLRAVVKTAMVKYGYNVIGFKNGYRGLVLNNFNRFKPDDVSGILDKGGTILGTSDRDNPFNFMLEKDGIVEYKDMSDIVIENAKMFGIDSMVIIGGNGTLKSARDLARKGLNVVGVPKSINNDIFYTDMTFGFMTAVETATDAIDKLHSTAESHHRVMILEVVGNKTGWIALEAGLAGGADIILIPEIPYDINRVAQKIMERKNVGKHFSIIVAAEGARAVNEENEPGIGGKLAEQLELITNINTKVTVLGYLQRGGRPVPYDRVLSTRYGVAAAELIHRENFGVMVSLKGNEITSVPLEEAVDCIKTVPAEGELISIARSVGVGLGD